VRISKAAKLRWKDQQERADMMIEHIKTNAPDSLNFWLKSAYTAGMDAAVAILCGIGEGSDTVMHLIKEINECINVLNWGAVKADTRNTRP